MLLEIRDLTVYYETVLALKGISAHVDEGEIVAMIGPNGAGKSTTLKAIIGLLKATDGEITSGEIIFKEKSIKNIPPHKLVKRGISLVPEDRRIFPTMSIQENLEMGAFNIKSQKTVKDTLEEVFDFFPILHERKKQKAGKLSAGEQQMLSIARALMLQPTLLLIDEPSLGLSPNHVEAVFDKIREINQNGTSILLVEQNVRTALEYSDRGYVFQIGEIAFEDTGKNLLANKEIKKTFLGE